MLGVSVPTDFPERISTTRSRASLPTYSLPSLISSSAVGSLSSAAVRLTSPRTKIAPIKSLFSCMGQDYAGGHRLAIAFAVGESPNLFVTQRFDRVEVGRFIGRVGSKNNSHKRTDHQPENDPIDRNHGRYLQGEGGDISPD